MEDVSPAPRRRRTQQPRRAIKKRRTGGYSRPQRALGMHPGTYKFKRSLVFDIDVKNNTGMPGSIICTDGKGVVWNYSIALDSMPGYTDFENLFEQYKLTSTKLKFFPKWNVTTTQAGGNQNLILRYKKARDGRALDSTNTEAKWLEMAATESHTMPAPNDRPIEIWTPLSQLSKRYSGVASGTEDYAITTPDFISTDEHSTPHYGMQFRFDTYGQDIDDLPTYVGQFKLEACVYFQCRSTR